MMKYKIKNAFLLISIIICGYKVSISQSTNNTPAQMIAEKRKVKMEDPNVQFKVQNAWRLSIIDKWAKILYRKPTENELDLVAVKPEHVSRYRFFLQNENSGVIKLLPSLGCPFSSKIVSADTNCNDMPGHGSAYSFRVKNYRLERLADLLYIDNSFQSSGILSHGILVNIGNVPLENVDLNTKGIRYLLNFKPENEFKKAKLIDQELRNGIENDGFIYKRELRAVENATYVLRSIAYDGKYVVSIDGVSYDEFNFDNRFDVIIAFHVIEKAENGSVTIIWKELKRTKSPKLKGF